MAHVRKAFSTIVDEWLLLHATTVDQLEVDEYGDLKGRLASSFFTYHAAEAVAELLCVECHKAEPMRKTPDAATASGLLLAACGFCGCVHGSIKKEAACMHLHARTNPITFAATATSLLRALPGGESTVGVTFGDLQAIVRQSATPLAFHPLHPAEAPPPLKRIRRNLEPDMLSIRLNEDLLNQSFCQQQSQVPSFLSGFTPDLVQAELASTPVYFDPSAEEEFDPSAVEVVAVALMRPSPQGDAWELLLVQRAPEIDRSVGKWHNPGGWKRNGELPVEAAAREIFEELGVVAWNLVRVGPSIRAQHPSSTAGPLLALYATTSWSGEPTLKEHQQNFGWWRVDSSDAQLPRPALRSLAQCLTSLRALRPPRSSSLPRFASQLLPHASHLRRSAPIPVGAASPPMRTYVLSIVLQDAMHWCTTDGMPEPECRSICDHRLHFIKRSAFLKYDITHEQLLVPASSLADTDRLHHQYNQLLPLIAARMLTRFEVEPSYERFVFLGCFEAYELHDILSPLDGAMGTLQRLLHGCHGFCPGSLPFTKALGPAVVQEWQRVFGGGTLPHQACFALSRESLRITLSEATINAARDKVAQLSLELQPMFDELNALLLPPALLLPTTTLRPLPHRQLGPPPPSPPTSPPAPPPPPSPPASPPASPLLPLDGTGRKFRHLPPRHGESLATLQSESFLSLVFPLLGHLPRPSVCDDILECWYIIDGHEKRFGSRVDAVERRRFASIPTELHEAISRVACFFIRQSSRGDLMLAAVQITWMDPWALRGLHNDNPDHGDAIGTMVISGAGTVVLTEVPDEPTAPRCEVTLTEGDCYILFGKGLSHSKHAIAAGPEGRLSITFRFVYDLQAARRAVYRSDGPSTVYVPRPPNGRTAAPPAASPPPSPPVSPPATPPASPPVPSTPLSERKITSAVWRAVFCYGDLEDARALAFVSRSLYRAASRVGCWVWDPARTSRLVRDLPRISRLPTTAVRTIQRIVRGWLLRRSCRPQTLTIELPAIHFAAPLPRGMGIGRAQLHPDTLGVLDRVEQLSGHVAVPPAASPPPSPPTSPPGQAVTAGLHVAGAHVSLQLRVSQEPEAGPRTESEPRSVRASTRAPPRDLEAAHLPPLGNPLTLGDPRALHVPRITRVTLPCIRLGTRDGVVVGPTTLMLADGSGRLRQLGLHTQVRVPRGGLLALVRGTLHEHDGDGADTGWGYHFAIDCQRSIGPGYHPSTCIPGSRVMQRYVRDYPWEAINEPADGTDANAVALYWCARKVRSDYSTRKRVGCYAIHAARELQAGEEIFWRYSGGADDTYASHRTYVPGEPAPPLSPRWDVPEDETPAAHFGARTPADACFAV